MTEIEIALLQEAKTIQSHLTEKLTKDGNSITSLLIEQVRVFRQGNYTVVLVNNEVIGVSKRNKKDKYNVNTGVRKALYRAVKGFMRANIVKE